MGVSKLQRNRQTSRRPAQCGRRLNTNQRGSITGYPSARRPERPARRGWLRRGRAARYRRQASSDSLRRTLRGACRRPRVGLPPADVSPAHRHIDAAVSKSIRLPSFLSSIGWDPLENKRKFLLLPHFFFQEKRWDAPTPNLRREIQQHTAPDGLFHC